MPRSGITFLNPEIEWALAAKWWGYKYEEFQELPGDVQSHRIAVYRIAHQMEAVVAYEASRRTGKSGENGI